MLISNNVTLYELEKNSIKFVKPMLMTNPLVAVLLLLAIAVKSALFARYSEGYHMSSFRLNRPSSRPAVTTDPYASSHRSNTTPHKTKASVDPEIVYIYLEPEIVRSMKYFGMIDISEFERRARNFQIVKISEEKYICSVKNCHNTFASNGVDAALHFLKMHSHPSLTPFKCAKCKTTFNVYSYAVEHVEECFNNVESPPSKQIITRSPRENPYNQPPSSPRAFTVNRIENHIQPPEEHNLQLEKLSIFCQQEANLVNDTAFLKMKKWLMSLKTYECPLCKVTFSSHVVDQHVLSHSHYDLFQCKLCDLVAKSREELAYHFRQFHFPTERMLTAAKVFNFQISSDLRRVLANQVLQERNILSDDNLQRFLTVRTRNQNIKLPECTNENISLTEYLKANRLSDTIVYRCRICHSQFEGKSHSIWHLRFDHSLESIMNFKGDDESVIVIEDSDFNDQMVEPLAITTTTLSNTNYSTVQNPSHFHRYRRENMSSNSTYRDATKESELRPFASNTNFDVGSVDDVPEDFSTWPSSGSVYSTDNQTSISPAYLLPGQPLNLSSQKNNNFGQHSHLYNIPLGGGPPQHLPGISPRSVNKQRPLRAPSDQRQTAVGSRFGGPRHSPYSRPNTSTSQQSGKY